MSQKGSSTDLTAPKSNFRFAPENGLKSDIASCPGWAISCLRANLPVSIKLVAASFDEIVGEL